MALLTLDNLTMRFGGVVALEALSLEVEAGEVVGLIGPNGSGKTTCFNVVTGIYAPNAGRVRFADIEIAGESPQRVHRAGIARTFQRSRLCLALSIFDNLMIGNHTRLDHGMWFNLVRRREFARRLGLEREAARALLATFSSDLAGRLGDAVATLPMIDRRRIEICRALISRPKLLLLDEPSAGMTPEETRQLMDDILEVRARSPGLAIIVIEHEMGMIEQVCERCVVLNYGRKICEGSYAEVAADAEVRAAYLGPEESAA
ncbi:MAG: ABC transporter ATP-binding protein [Alphaproteobacteria bacterium]|jgi:ABC-type branched-subunit amino acid transport system ATPase component|nr:ABC transporter ATP-binding protein [Alphaproteobacteria bacterium]MDP6517957.1 ABC transporter ATP-binding protein [Alphaproteobacteria bacterium]